MTSNPALNSNYTVLDSDTDILLISKDTFIVARFKEIARKSLQQKLSVYYLDAGQYEGKGKGSIMWYLHTPLSIGELSLTIPNSQWIFSEEGIDCQLLKVGNTSWQQGKLKIEAKLPNIEINLYFRPDEPLPPPSPLDELRQTEAYQKLVN